MLSPVKGERSQPAHRSRSVRPASRAMRSSSDGHTYRDRRPQLAHDRPLGDEVVRRGLLGDEVGVTVVSHVARGVGEHPGVLAGWQAAKLGDADTAG